MEHLQWCIDQTLEELERSRRRNRPITWPNLRRLFERRWEGAARDWLPEEGIAGEREAARLHGMTALEEWVISSRECD